MSPSVGRFRGQRGLLAEPLVRPGLIVVADVLGHDALEVPVVEHQDVVEALATQRTEKAFADGVHVRRAHRRADHPDAGGAGQRIEGGPELVVAVANQEPWRRTQGGRVAKLLRHPDLRREACRRGEYELAGGQFDEHERADRAEEHVVGLHEVASPDLVGVVS